MPSSPFAKVLMKDEINPNSARRIMDLLPADSYARTYLGNYLNIVGGEVYNFLHLENGPRNFMDALSNAIGVALQYDRIGDKNKHLNPMLISFFRPQIATEIAGVLCPEEFADSVRYLCGYKPRAS